MSGSEGIVHLLLGNNTAHVISTAQANQLALALRLNEESVSTKCLTMATLTHLVYRAMRISVSSSRPCGVKSADTKL